MPSGVEQLKSLGKLSVVVIVMYVILRPVSPT